jgi:hypothetical protein
MSSNDEPTLFGSYPDGTGGYVDRPSSKARAMRESHNGKFSARQQLILAHLERAGGDGMTWQQLAKELGFHHGQVSGCLSNLHRSGFVFMVVEQRDKCHPYVHFKYRVSYRDHAVYDEPVKTKSTQRLEALEQLLSVCIDAIDNGFTHADISEIKEVVNIMTTDD